MSGLRDLVRDTGHKDVKATSALARYKDRLWVRLRPLSPPVYS